MLGVPMMHDGKVIGVIVLAWKEPGPVLPRYVELLQTFAAQAPDLAKEGIPVSPKVYVAPAGGGD